MVYRCVCGKPCVQQLYNDDANREISTLGCQALEVLVWPLYSPFRAFNWLPGGALTRTIITYFVIGVGESDE
jgi:hypothetical protein